MGILEGMEILGILFLIAGFILVGVEMVIPGFGVSGISGIVCLILGILVSADSVEQGLTITIIVVVILAIMLTVTVSILKKVKPAFVLDDKLKAEDDFINNRDLDYLVGKKGIASTDLRPCGKCKIEGVEFDVRADGVYISKDTSVKIVRIHENAIIVKKD